MRSSHLETVQLEGEGDEDDEDEEKHANPKGAMPAPN